MLKAIDATSITERPPWGLIEDAVTWARRGERDAQTSEIELLDEFYLVASQLWSADPSNSRKSSSVRNQC